MASQDVFEDDHTYIFIASNRKFLEKVHREPGSRDCIEAEKTLIDVHCTFRTSLMEDGKVAFKADDGRGNYLSRIDGDSIEASKKAIDVHCMFNVEVDSRGPWNRARFVYLKADNGKYWGMVERDGYRQNIEAHYDRKNEAGRFIVFEAK